MCRSLSDEGYSVYLLVADGNGDDVREGIQIKDVGRSLSRVKRILFTTQKIYKHSLQLDAAIYHLHDPELLPLAINLMRKGKCVIFDSHEDVPSQISSKWYLSKINRFFAATLYSLYERLICTKINGLIVPTSHIREKFVPINPLTCEVRNYPMIKSHKFCNSWASKKDEIVYAGDITDVRGIYEMVKAMELVKSPIRLNLFGKFRDLKLEKKVRELSGWNKVNYHGYCSKDKIREVTSYSIAGLVVLHPTPSYINALPVKMFDYMESSIPPIASNFQLWNEILINEKCGMVVDPMKPSEIARSIDFVYENPGIAQSMGERGRKAIFEKYNWSSEQTKLLDFYQHLLSQNKFAQFRI